MLCFWELIVHLWGSLHVSCHRLLLAMKKRKKIQSRRLHLHFLTRCWHFACEDLHIKFWAWMNVKMLEAVHRFAMNVFAFCAKAETLYSAAAKCGRTLWGVCHSFASVDAISRNCLVSQQRIALKQEWKTSVGTENLVYYSGVTQSSTDIPLLQLEVFQYMND